MRRKLQKVDVAEWRDLVEDALSAFGQDHRYAEAIARRAVVLRRLTERRKPGHRSDRASSAPS